MHTADLTRLIVERLQSDDTPPAVRSAIALSAVQGLQFLCALTESAGSALRVSGIAEGLSAAEEPYRLVSHLDDGVAAFVQRAYRDAARSIVGNELGDPERVQAALLKAATALIDDPVALAQLSGAAQVACLGVFVGLAEADPDEMMRRRAGAAILRLVEIALTSSSGADYARAGELAMRFVAGLDGNWQVDQFDLMHLLNA